MLANQRLNSDVTIENISFRAMNKRIFPLELFIYVHEILQITYLAKTASEILATERNTLENTLVLNGLNRGVEPAKTKDLFLM